MLLSVAGKHNLANTLKKNINDFEHERRPCQSRANRPNQPSQSRCKRGWH